MLRPLLEIMLTLMFLALERSCKKIQAALAFPSGCAPALLLVTGPVTGLLLCGSTATAEAPTMADSLSEMLYQSLWPHSRRAGERGQQVSI